MNNEFEDGVGSTELGTEAGHNETRIYELGFHIDPELPQEEVRRTYQGLRERASRIVAEGEPQKIPLAYTISKKVQGGGRRDFDTAFLSWFAYEATGSEHDAIIEAAKAEERIIRFIDLRTDTETAQHAAEMHEIYARLGAEREAAASANANEEGRDADLDAALKEAGA